MSFGRAFIRALGGAALAWLAMILVACAIDPTIAMLLVFWPGYGIWFVGSGLAASLWTAWLLRRVAPGWGILIGSAVLTVAIFAALPLWFLSNNRGSTRW